jgi:hypothetical protein
MKVELIEEHEGGSATFSFDLEPHEVKVFVELGIQTALTSTLKELANETPSNS